MSKSRAKKLRERNASKGQSETEEPRLYPSGTKVFDLTFSYGYDIGIPNLHAINVRLPRKRGGGIGSVQWERVNGSVIIDEARVSDQNKPQTRSKHRLPKTANIIVGIKDTQPIHYRLHQYNRIIASSYRTHVRIRTYGDYVKQGPAIKAGLQIFNQYLSAYRLASGDPVPLIHEDKKDLGITTIKYRILSSEEEENLKDTKKAIDYLSVEDGFVDGGMTAGISTTDFDMVPKPYVKEIAVKTVEYSFLPENIPFHNEPILEAIELAHRKNEYGLGIVLLNLAFEAAITFNLLMCLAFLDLTQKESTKIITEDLKDLEDKRKNFDSYREQVLQRYKLPAVKRFRGSVEEQKWNSSTYKKRHIVVHITNSNNGDITKKDFEVALAATQKAIALLELPVDEIKEARKKNDTRT